MHEHSNADAFSMIAARHPALFLKQQYSWSLIKCVSLQNQQFLVKTGA